MGARIDLDNARLRATLSRLGHTAEPGKLHLIGLRGCVPVARDVVEIVPNQFNRYNDTIGYFGAGFGLYLGSVDPGRTWTLRPSNPKGCAHLVNGVWLYQRGLHRGKPAFVQAGPFTVRRDRDRDGRDEPGEPLDTGWFGINLHPGGTAPTIGAWSGGCQIIKGGWTGRPWMAFRDTVYAAPQRVFRYFLLDAEELLK